MTQNEIEQKFKAQKLELEIEKAKERNSIIENSTNELRKLHELFISLVKEYKTKEYELRRKIVDFKMLLAEDKIRLNSADYAQKEIRFLKDKNDIETEISENNVDCKIAVEKYSWRKRELNDEKNAKLSDINLKYSIKLQDLKNQLFKEIEENRKEIEKENE